MRAHIPSYLHPRDPECSQDYDPEALMDEYERQCEAAAEDRREREIEWTD